MLDLDTNLTGDLDGAQAVIDQLQILFNEALLEAAELVLVPAIKQTISEFSPPVSEPDMPPHTRVGVLDHQGFLSLIESIRAWIDGTGAVVIGSDGCPYGLYLEVGTQHMAARPWLQPTLDRNDVRHDFVAMVESILARRFGELGSAAPGDLQDSATEVRTPSPITPPLN